MSRVFATTDQSGATGISSIFANLAALTVAAWVNLSAYSSSGNNVILVNDPLGGYQLYLEIVGDVGNAGVVAAGVGAVASSGSDVNNTVPLGSWTHVAMTWDSNTDGKIRLYINGSEVTGYDDQTADTVPDPSPGPIYVGNDTFGEPTIADVAEVVMYNSALSAGQIAALAASTSGATGTPIAYWHLCGSSDPEPDSSGNGNDLTLNDSPAAGPDSPGYSCVGPTTRNVVAVGSYGGDSLAEAFYNPHRMDILQVVNEGGKVVWNLDYAGEVEANPDDATSNALLGRFEGESFALAFPNPQGDNVLQIIGQGDVIVFWIDSTGAAGSN